MLQHCFPQNLRQFLNEFPETLDETYERILKVIKQAQKDDAHRLLHCLAAAVRPLRVDEIAELLAFDSQASSSGRVPELENWRWEDYEKAVLSTCSGLIAVGHSGDSRVIQFSHFSVKAYLTSPRLARSPCADVSQFHVDLEAAHTIMAQACLATLLRLDEHDGQSDDKRSPLVKYAAQYWVEHAQFEKVSSRVRDGMDNLFDSSKPHFAAWIQVHDVDESWPHFSTKRREHHGGSPLYYAAFFGFYDLAEHLIRKHPEQVNASGGRIAAPLPAALYKRHFRVANLLHKHGADVDIRGSGGWKPLHAASAQGYTDIIRWLLDHGADINARTNGLRTPLHLAAVHMRLESTQVLLEHNADVNLQNHRDWTPLYQVIFASGTRPVVAVTAIARRLLQHGADPNIRASDDMLSTPLHLASFMGFLEVARLLLSYGAKVDETDKEGKTPFQVASRRGYDEITKLLLEHGAVPQP
jgi:ankyrin repeat protein